MPGKRLPDRCEYSSMCLLLAFRCVFFSSVVTVYSIRVRHIALHIAYNDIVRHCITSHPYFFFWSSAQHFPVPKTKTIARIILVVIYQLQCSVQVYIYTRPHSLMSQKPITSSTFALIQSCVFIIFNISVPFHVFLIPLNFYPLLLFFPSSTLDDT